MAGTLTRTQIINHALNNLARSGNLTLRSGETLTTQSQRWLNWAQYKICRKADLLFKISTASTVASQDCYSMPTRIRSLYTVRLINGLESDKLDCVMPWDMDEFVPKLDAFTTGQPRIYIPYKTTDHFQLYPVPDAVYTIKMRYSYWPTDFSTDTQKSDYSFMDDVLVFYTTMYGFQWAQEMKDANFWEARGDEALNEARRLEEQQSFPDWAPRSRGFTSGSVRSIGEYYNDPFVREML